MLLVYERQSKHVSLLLQPTSVVLCCRTILAAMMMTLPRPPIGLQVVIDVSLIQCQGCRWQGQGGARESYLVVPAPSGALEP